MTIAPFQPGSVTIPEGMTEEELYVWMDSKTGGLYEKAQQSVNEWWSAVVVALIAADQFYGWDSMAGASIRSEGKAEMPERLKNWCHANGLDSTAKIGKARRVARACLSSSFDVVEIIEEIGPSKLNIIGGSSEFVRMQLLESAIDGASQKSIIEQAKELQNSPECLEQEIERKKQVAQDRLEQRKKLTPHTPEYNNANAAYHKALASIRDTEEKLKNTQENTANTGTCTSTEGDTFYDVKDQSTEDQIADLKALFAKQMLEKNKEIEELKAQVPHKVLGTELDQKDREIKHLKSRLTTALRELEEPVDPRLRLAGIQLRAASGPEEAHDFFCLKDRPDADQQTIEKIKRGMVLSITSWIDVLPYECVEEIRNSLDGKTENMDNVTNTNTIIDV